MQETSAPSRISAARHLHPANSITQQDIDDFQRDGVVCLRGMFKPEWTDMLREASLEAMESGAGRTREPKLEPGKGRFYSNVYLSDLDERFRLLRDASPASEIAAKLMGCDEVRYYYDQLFIKTPGTAAPTPWHNDLPFWPFRGNDLISIWIALTPVTAESSGVQYVAGSHRWNKMFRAVTPDYDPRFLDPALEECPDYGSPDTPAAGKVLSWDMQPGDILCHHPLTVHGAAGNKSATQTRVGLSIRYLGPDVQWDPRPHTMTLRRPPNVEPGQYPADDIAFPRTWDSQHGLLQPEGPAKP